MADALNSWPIPTTYREIESDRTIHTLWIAVQETKDPDFVENISE
jgi:hypothetical protein